MSSADPLLDTPKLRVPILISYFLFSTKNLTNQIKVFNAESLKKLFNGAISYDIDYKPRKLLDLEELKSFVVDQFPNLEKAI
jgi:hypothetical protein